MRQYLQAGLIDEIHLVASPTVLGSGERLLEGIDLLKLGYRCKEHVMSPAAKALNTVNCDIMVAPERVPGDHSLIICGNDKATKVEVTKHLCDWFGWKPANIIDLGDITASRGTEMFLALWIRLYGLFGSPHFNIHIVRGT